MQKRLESRQEGLGDNLRSFGGWMNAVFLDRVWNVDKILVDHRDESSVVLHRKIAKDLVKGADIILSIIRRQSDPSQEYLDVSAVEGCQHCIQVLPRLFERKAAQSVIAA